MAILNRSGQPADRPAQEHGQRRCERLQADQGTPRLRDRPDVREPQENHGGDNARGGQGHAGEADDHADDVRMRDRRSLQRGLLLRLRARASWLNDSAFGATSADAVGDPQPRRPEDLHHTEPRPQRRVAKQQSLSTSCRASANGIDLGCVERVDGDVGTGHIITMVENRAFNNTEPGCTRQTTAVNYNVDHALRRHRRTGSSPGRPTSSSRCSTGSRTATASTRRSTATPAPCPPATSRRAGSRTRPAWPVGNDTAGEGGDADRLQRDRASP